MSSNSERLKLVNQRARDIRNENQGMTWREARILAFREYSTTDEAHTSSVRSTERKSKKQKRVSKKPGPKMPKLIQDVLDDPDIQRVLNSGSSD